MFLSFRASDGVCARVPVSVAPFFRPLVNSEASNTTSVMFLKTTGHVEASGPLDYFGRAEWRHFCLNPSQVKSKFIIAQDHKKMPQRAVHKTNIGKI